MPLLNKLFGKKSKSPVTKIAEKREENKKSEVVIKKPEVPSVALKERGTGILISPFTTEKALSGEKISQYIFKVLSSANKIDIAKEVSKTYNVKAVSVRIINVSKKARRVGKNSWF